MSLLPRPTDLRGAAALATQAVVGVTDVVEGVHRSVLSTLGLHAADDAPGTRGITGFVYRSVRGVTRVVGRSADVVLSSLETSPIAADAPSSRRRDAMLAVLNGVMGDRLVREGSPLAIPMQLRHQGVDLAPAPPPHMGDKVLLLIHGLCMHDLQWQPASGKKNAGAQSDHAHVLASTLGYTPIHLRYNTGLHISDNGAALARLLEDTFARWPVALAHLAVLTHSMGGLVMRSAVEAARRDKLRWLEQLRHIVFLGTPHHGAPLERAGNLIDRLLGSTPYTRPLAALGQLRSAGITDLRHGHVRMTDWDGRGRFEGGQDRRLPLALPKHVACHTVAAATAAGPGMLAQHLTGDGLVPLRSALGQHREARRRLQFAPDSQFIAWRTNHLQLLHRPQVTAQLLRWLGDGAAPAPDVSGV